MTLNEFYLVIRAVMKQFSEPTFPEGGTTWYGMLVMHKFCIALPGWSVLPLPLLVDRKKQHSAIGRQTMHVYSCLAMLRHV